MYSRTQNENGSFNTRCLDCYMTVASCIQSEQELDRVEAAHMCPEKALNELVGLQRRHTDHAPR